MLFTKLGTTVASGVLSILPSAVGTKQWVCYCSEREKY